MASGLTRLKVVCVAALIAAPLLAGCHDDNGATISWSPSGRKVAFISGDQPWTYDLVSGWATRVPVSGGQAESVAWSPSEDTLAVSTASLVEIFTESQGRYIGGLAFTVPSLGNPTTVQFAWHPKGRRIRLSQVLDDRLETHEITVSSSVIDTAPGLGFYGPGGRWSLWMSQVYLGHDKEKMVFAREDMDGKPLPISTSDLAILEENDPLSVYGDAPCVTNLFAGREKVYCFDAAGALKLKADLPKEGTIYPNRSQTLFAVMDEEVAASTGPATAAAPAAPALRLLDSKGRLKASGERFMRKVAEELKDQSGTRTSNLVWSPDGNWLAWVVGGRLCLWNWRNDVVRILPPLDQ
jgi:WD40 repeat protein